jgi:hypothetical protein
MILRGMRILGALAVLAVGAVHLQQYLGADFRMIPTVGSLFLLNAIGSGIVGVGLLVSEQRVLTGRKADGAVAMFAIAALAIAVGSLVALFISESGSLFGFSESGYRAAVVVAIISEAATILLLAPVAAVSLGRVLAHRPEPTPRRDGGRWLRRGRAA